MSNIYEGKTAIIINIDHTVRTTISGQFYITEPGDSKLVTTSLPILAALHGHGYTVIGVSMQPNLSQHSYDLGSYLACFEILQESLGEISFDQLYFNQHVTWDFKDTRCITLALKDFRLGRRSCLYVGVTDSEAVLCKVLGIPFINALEFFQRIPFRMEIEKLYF